jgi:endonuclease/exonuclease/phosphatase family metal-dependent hydrolase
MKVVVQNLQKRPGLASSLVHKHEPDVLLAQEISLKTEEPIFGTAHNTSKLGYGTAIYGMEAVTDVRLVSSPHAEIGGFIVKKTTVACCAGVQFVSFHGYNGQPMKSVSKLTDHVAAVLAVIPPGTPALFAGDFNTWTELHINAVKALMAKAGFTLAYSWPYPGRDLPLDHAFVRSLRLESQSSYRNDSDHLGAVLELTLMM